VLARFAARASLWNRRRKLALFMESMRPGPETRVVDVGVGDTGFGTEPGVATSHNFFEALYPWPDRITAVSDVPLPNFAREFPQVRCVTANGTELPFEDDAFDIAFSNAVVEHVGGGREEQRRFVHELCRCSRRAFLTTPNRFFPLEVHTLVPFAHWLPRELRDRVLHARGFHDVLEPLGPGELASLFPYPVRIVNTGMTLIAVGPQ
jgi:hypothetical protein